MTRKQNTQQARIRESLAYIRSLTRMKPTVAIILGSGLGDFADTLTRPTVIETSAIPNYPQMTVTGHSGRLVFGKIGRVPLCVLQGRVHFYESGRLDTVLYPIRILSALGIKSLIITNAAGGINPGFTPGDLMLLTDQINLTFRRPLTGSQRAGVNVPHYDRDLQDHIRRTAAKLKLPIKEGVYCGVLGPSYETAAEIRMAGLIGADAIGMSTVNEVSLAVHSGMRVAGISCITNLSTGISSRKLDHSEVTEVANRVKETFANLLDGTVRDLASE